MGWCRKVMLYYKSRYCIVHFGLSINDLIIVSVNSSSLLSSTTVGDRSVITALTVGQWTPTIWLLYTVMFGKNQGKNWNAAVRAKQIHATLAEGVSQTWYRMTEGKILLGGEEKKIWIGVETKGGKMETDVRRESSKVRRDNENVSCFIGRTRAPKAMNWIWSGFTEVD